MRHSISPYPKNVKVNKAGQVFQDGKYIGYVDVIENWGTNHLGRPDNDGVTGPSEFFRTRTEAVKHILAIAESRKEGK